MNREHKITKLFISCNDATYLASKKQDKELSLAEKFKLRFHLLSCGLCRIYVKQLAWMQKTMYELFNDKTDTSKSFSEDKKAALQKMMENLI